MAISEPTTLPRALLQQYGLLAIFGRRLRFLARRPVVTDLGGSAIFALLHLQNPLLMSATFGAGYCVSILYRRSPNLFALALAHALVSVTIHYSLPVSITLSMLVGPGFLHKLTTGSAGSRQPDDAFARLRIMIASAAMSIASGNVSDS